MEQSVFFATVKSNLDLLCQERARLPEYYLPYRDFCVLRWFCGAFRVCRLNEVSKADPPAPENVRVWDLVGRRIIGRRPLKFRIFACYVKGEDGVAELVQVKRQLRHWYQQSGLHQGHDVPYAAALVVGWQKDWLQADQPKIGDGPSEVISEMWTIAGSDGPQVARCGDGVGKVVERAMMAETFAEYQVRVKAVIDHELEVNQGHTTVEKIADKISGEKDVNSISYVFLTLVAEGAYVLKRLSRRDDHGNRRTPEQRLYIEKGEPGWITRLRARISGKWYVQDRFLPAHALTFVGLVLCLSEKFLFEVVFKVPILENRWLSLGLILLCVSGWVLFHMIRRR